MEEQKMDLETAVTIIGSFKVLSIKTLNSCGPNILPEEKKILKKKINELEEEIKLLLRGNEDEKQIIFHKVLELYSPKLREHYSKSKLKGEYNSDTKVKRRSHIHHTY